jgi:integrase
MRFTREETKNRIALEFELSAVLSQRLHVYRNEIAPAVLGRRPDLVFVTGSGAARSQAAIMLAIQKSIIRHVGIKITPHQFRHLLAKVRSSLRPDRSSSACSSWRSASD